MQFIGLFPSHMLRCGSEIRPSANVINKSFLALRCNVARPICRAVGRRAMADGRAGRSAGPWSGHRASLSLLLFFGVLTTCCPDAVAVEPGSPAPQPAPANRFELQAPRRPGAFQSGCAEAGIATGDGVYRFALMPGDRWHHDRSARKGRVELRDRFAQPAGSTHRYRFDLFIPDLAQFTAAWTLVGQWHAGTRTTAGVRRPADSPPVAQMFTADGMALRLALPAPERTDGKRQRFADILQIKPFPTGRWVSLDYTLHLATDGTGRLVVRQDDQPPLLRYEGPLGDPAIERLYFKIGLYRGSDAGSQRICIRNYVHDAIGAD